MTRPLLFIRNPDVDISMGVRSLTHKRGIVCKHTPPYQCRYMKHTQAQISSRPILFSARTVTPTSLHPCHGPPRRSSTSSLLINTTWHLSVLYSLLRVRAYPTVRPLRRGPIAIQQSNNPTYEQTQCQNPLRPRTVVRDATLPRTSDQIASLRNQNHKHKIRGFGTDPHPYRCPHPHPHPADDKSKPSIQLRQAASHTTGHTIYDTGHHTTRPRAHTRSTRAGPNGQRSSELPCSFLSISPPSFLLRLLSAFCFCFCSSIPEPRASGLGPPSSPTTSTALLDNRNYLCFSQAALPSARWHVLQYLQPSTAMFAAFSNKAPCRDLP